MQQNKKQLEVGTEVRHYEKGHGVIAGFSKAYAIVHVRYDNGDSDSFQNPRDFESGELVAL